jgi:Arc/MetJ family transcription regulator
MTSVADVIPADPVRVLPSALPALLRLARWPGYRGSLESPNVQQYSDFCTVTKRDDVMAAATNRSQSARLGRPPRGWVRKNLHIDQRKLDAARKVLGVKTETETVDAALDAIAFRKELSRALRRARAAGGLKDIYKD